jgi:hypothetical protein
MVNAPDDGDRFQRVGESASQVRRAAYESYSRAADLVRERIKAVGEAHPPLETPLREQGLALALRMKELTERELDHADQNWREWVEEARARQDEARLQRQEKATTSATWAAWAAAFAAFMSAVVAAWQVFGPFVSAWMARPRS